MPEAARPLVPAGTRGREPRMSERGGKRMSASTVILPGGRAGAGEARWVLGGLWLAAGWPVLVWYVRRLHDGTDEPLGLVPLVLALVLAPRSGWRDPLSGRAARALWMTGVLLALAQVLAPPLVRASVWIAGWAILVKGLSTSGTSPGRTIGLAWGVLLTLSLPWLATVQFFAGYPLRRLTTTLVAGLLSLGGMEIEAEGTVLQWRGEQVLVDAPCSGVQMGWTLLVLASTLAVYRGLDTRTTLRVFRWAGLVGFSANLFRTLALFGLETLFPSRPEWAHDAIGLSIFAAAVGSLWRGLPDDRALRVSTDRRRAELPRYPHRTRRWTLVWVVLGPWLILQPLWSGFDQPANTATASFPGWETAPLPPGLEPVPLSALDERFARQFPGRIGVFRRGPERWIVRWVVQPTRKLHSSVDCLRAVGYSVTPGRAWRDPQGALWSGADAVGRGERWQVQERILDEHGRGWTDVSAWYWSQVFASKRTPCWAITRLILQSTD